MGIAEVSLSMGALSIAWTGRGIILSVKNQGHLFSIWGFKKGTLNQN
jgi:hypothetical protein